MMLEKIISNKALIRDKAFINGSWIGSNNPPVNVTNPADGLNFATVASLDAADVLKAIEAADTAFKQWRRTTAKERAAYLWRWYDLILANQEDIAKIMTVEQGKPLTESRAEVAFSAAFIEWYAEEARRAYGDIIPTTANDRRIMVLREPIGVVGAITPWNFPCSMITRKVAPALAAGCTVVLKPSEETPLTALALAYLAEQAGVPAGVFNVVTGKASVIGAVMMESDVVRKISFTGSTEVGKQLYAQSAMTVKKLSLELGGNAPFIVFSDADIKRAAKAAAVSRFRNSGQTCVCANRILVQANVHDKFIEALTVEIAAFKTGNGLESGINQGPLINQLAVTKVENLVERAVKSGADLISGGHKISGSGSFYQPTIISNVTPEMDIATHEIFGPVAAVISFSDEHEALEMANNTPYGLAAYFFTEDYRRITRVSERLQYGMVGVNEGLISTEVAPFGGYKESGIGRECGREGLLGFMETKYVCLGGLS